jgi:hypothetical protein
LKSVLPRPPNEFGVCHSKPGSSRLVLGNQCALAQLFVAVLPRPPNEFGVCHSKPGSSRLVLGSQCALAQLFVAGTD